MVDIEVVAEDGTSKKYSIEVSKLSARTAVLSELSIEGDVQLHPAFSANIYEYSSGLPNLLPYNKSDIASSQGMMNSSVLFNTVI